MTNLIWYTSLVKSENKRSLMNYVDIEIKNLVVSQKLDNMYFTVFNTYADYAMYFVKKVTEPKKCFYEIIYGNHIQKPYFDVDVKIGPVSNENVLTISDAVKLRDQIIDSILKEFDYIKIEDIMVFNSNSSEKYSYHIIVDNWCTVDNEENKIFCSKVNSNIDTNLSIFIDSLVYKSIQQLRIYKCHKYKSDRTKILDPITKWKPKEKPISQDHEYCLILSGSLVGNTSYCKAIESLKPIEKKKKWEGNDIFIGEDDPQKCLDLLVDDNFNIPYTVKSVEGSMIMLNRHLPSMCKICNRIHENENPYLIVVGNKRKIYFDCRRTDSGRKLYIGELGETGYANLLDEDQVKQIIPEQEVCIPTQKVDDENIFPKEPIPLHTNTVRKLEKPKNIKVKVVPSSNDLPPDYKLTSNFQIPMPIANTSVKCLNLPSLNSEKIVEKSLNIPINRDYSSRKCNKIESKVYTSMNERKYRPSFNRLKIDGFSKNTLQNFHI